MSPPAGISIFFRTLPQPFEFHTLLFYKIGKYQISQEGNSLDQTITFRLENMRLMEMSFLVGFPLKILGLIAKRMRHAISEIVPLPRLQID